MSGGSLLEDARIRGIRAIYTKMTGSDVDLNPTSRYVDVIVRDTEKKKAIMTTATRPRYTVKGKIDLVAHLGSASSQSQSEDDGKKKEKRGSGGKKSKKNEERRKPEAVQR